jgi:hypothetical protein
MKKIRDWLDAKFKAQFAVENIESGFIVKVMRLSDGKFFYINQVIKLGESTESDIKNFYTITSFNENCINVKLKKTDPRSLRLLSEVEINSIFKAHEK